MSTVNRAFNCKLLNSEDSVTLSSKSKAFQCYDGDSEIFYFPMILSNKTNKRELLARTFVVDPSSTYISSRTKEKSQVPSDRCGYLRQQDNVESEIPEPSKPLLLQQIEEKMSLDRMEYDISDDQSSPIRLQMFREVFDLFIDSCGHYKVLLSQIKSQYDHYINHMNRRIGELLPLTEIINTISIECENRIKGYQHNDNKEIKHLKADKRRDMVKIEKLKLETKEYIVMVTGLEKELLKETEQHLTEQNGRKLALQSMNQLSDQVIYMGNAIEMKVDKAEEDPVKLRATFENCKKNVAKAQHKIVEYESRFEATVPLANLEEIGRNLEVEHKLSLKLNEQLLELTKQYDLLQEHCASLSTHRDLYQVQCQYVLRVIGSKSEPAQKIEYIGLLLNKWNRLIADRPIADLTRMAGDEVKRYESGGIPPLSRMNRNKRSVV